MNIQRSCVTGTCTEGTVNIEGFSQKVKTIYVFRLQTDNENLQFLTHVKEPSKGQLQVLFE